MRLTLARPQRGPMRRMTGALGCLLAAAAALPATGHATTGGSAVGWGRNFARQLGAGFKTEHGIGGESSPVAVVGLSNVVELISSGGWSLARLSDGTVRAWGDNTFGELGDGTREGTLEEGTGEEGEAEEFKSTVGGLEHVKQIAAAGTHGLALLEDGEVMAWGNDQSGELGNGTSGNEKERQKKAEEEGKEFESGLTPKVVKGLSGVEAVAAGGASDFALVDGGTKIMSWGQNNKEQLGLGEIHGKVGPETCKTEIGELACSTVPREVQELTLPSGVTVKSISAGEVAAYALLSNGHVLAWGDNGKGQLGTGGANKDFGTPQAVAKVTSGLAVAGGAEDALVLLSDGEVLGMGASGGGELGESSKEAEEEQCQKVACHDVPQPISGLSAVTAVAAGDDFSFAVSAGTVYAFGRNTDGKLGTGSTAEKSSVPTAIKGIGAVTAVSASVHSALALLESGVAPPAPLVSAVPGVESVQVSWTIGERASEAKEVNITDHPLSNPKERSKKLTFFEPGNHLFSGLRAEPYVFTLINGGASAILRAIVATPNP
jgi:alpha-tubulin suppressor-like RCC1 family protein